MAWCWGTAEAADPWAETPVLGPTGRATSLAEVAGGDRLVVVVMKGSWCGVCVEQLRRLGEHRAALATLETRVVGLVVEDEVPSAPLAGAAILADPGHQLTDQLGFWMEAWGHPMPGLVIFDRCGAERGRVMGRRPGARPEPALLKGLGAIAAEPERCTPTTPPAS